MSVATGKPWQIFVVVCRRHGHLVLVLAVLGLWSVLQAPLAGGVFVIAWIAATQLIFAGSLESARLRRRAWLGQYMRATGPWYRWLQGGWLMIVCHQLTGALLALLLLIKLRLLAASDWLLLALAAVVLVGLGRVLYAFLARHVIEDYLPAVTRRLIVPPAAAVLATGLVLAALWRPQPYLVGLGWEQALASHMQSLEADSLLGAMERMASSLELTQLWAMQNAMERLDVGAHFAVLGWALLLLMQSAFAWAFIRTLVGADVLCRAYRSGDRKPAPTQVENEYD